MMNISWLYMYLGLTVTIVTYILRCSCTSQRFYVTKCPTTSRAWKMRSQILNCTWETFVNEYHCLRINTDQLIEMCFQAIALQPLDGCPYFSNDGLGILQKDCPIDTSGCLLASTNSTNETVLSSEGFKFQNCLKIHTTAGTRDPTLEDHGIDATTKAETTQKDNGTSLEGYILTLPILLLGSGVFLLICILVGCVVVFLCKRIAYLRERMEAVNYMSSVPYNSPVSHPYHESGNESIYDYAYDVDVDEIVRRNSDSGSYLEPNKRKEGNRNESSDSN